MNKPAWKKVLLAGAVLAGLVVLTLAVLKFGPGSGKPPGLSEEELTQQRMKEQQKNRILALQEREGRRNRFKRTFRKKAPSESSSLIMLEGRPGAQVIPVQTVSGEKSFTGEDLKDLDRVTVAFQQNGLAGWPPLDVLRRLGIETGQALVLFNGEGETLRLSWEQMTDDWPKVIFTYNNEGRLAALSGTELSPEEIQTVDPKSLPDPGPEGVFFPDIVRLEVIS